QRRHALAIERGERYAIEPHETRFGPDPQVPVSAEHQRMHAVLRQPLLRLPGVMAILREWFGTSTISGGLFRSRPRRKNEQDPAHDQPAREEPRRMKRWRRHRRKPRPIRQS